MQIRRSISYLFENNITLGIFVMIVAIHQPEHLPWPGFFHKMAQADSYVFLDTVQFTKNNWQNRNKLIDRKGETFWVTVPVLIKGHISSTIKDMRIDNTQHWQKKYWKRLCDAYMKHPYFNQYIEEIKSMIFSDCEYLVDINYDLINYFRSKLGISNRLVKASDLEVSGKKSELLANICLELKADTYLSGPSGRDYLDMEIFEDSGIEVRFHEFEHPTYPAECFTPHLSTLDLLMNCGKNSSRYLF